MREILFRGKRTDNGEWVEGDLVRHYENQRRFIACDQMAYTHTECGIGRLITERYCEVVPATVGQFTGLCDKNGKKIFEGDIVTGQFDGEKIVGWIAYGSEASFFIQREGLYGIGLNNAEDWLKVIGNIHDNAALLEQTP